MDIANSPQSPAAAVDNAIADWRATDWAAHTHTATLPGGGQVSYVEVAPATVDKAKPVVVLVHGLGASWHVWLENLHAVGRTHRVIAVDLPGFGASAPVDGVRGYHEFAGVLGQFIDALGLTGVVLGGNSFGGWVVADLTLDRPELVRGLVIVDGGGMVPTPKELKKVVRALRMAGKSAAFASRHRIRLTKGPIIRRLAFGALLDRGDRVAADLALYLVPEAPSPIFLEVLEIGATQFAPEWAERTRSITAPTLIVWGERDKLFPLRLGQEWHAHIAHSTMTTVTGAGHIPMLEQPAVVNPALSTFLAGLQG